MPAPVETPKKNGKKNSPAKKPLQRTQSKLDRDRLKAERESILLWRKPFTTLQYFTIELAINLKEWAQSLLQHKITLALLILASTICTVLYNSDGPYRDRIRSAEKYLLWCAWWVGLGVLSSVGLGTGLHTFILYLGPHIASVTLAAYECGSVDFPEPPYPESIVCPSTKAKGVMTIWQILSKVRVEAFCWGAGTALGELPPYFMARAARLSGSDPDDDDGSDNELEELMELKKRKAKEGDNLSYFERAKLGVERLVEKVGFFGILACASIPNPLFDLAGITCGHFLVPFWTFFGATLIGKAVIKMHIQKVFIVMAFNETLIESVVGYISRIPAVGPKLEAPFKELLRKQKEKLHKNNMADGAAGAGGDNSNVLSWIFEKFVLAMVAYFVISIVNSLAQSYHKRIHKKQTKKQQLGNGKLD